MMESLYYENEKNKDYRRLILEVGEEKFKERFHELVNTANDFIFKAGFSEYAACDERIMYHVLLDYYSDVFRLKEFHDIELIREEKIIAYTVHWIIKRKPIQFTKFPKDEFDIFVNERFGAELLLKACLKAGGKEIVPMAEKEHFDDYLDLLLYYLKYRTCDARVLELVIESFSMGAAMIGAEKR